MAIYGAICFGVSMLLCGTFSLKLAISSIWIFSNWFVVHFIVLLMLSPMIEKALRDISTRELGCWVVLLAIVNVVIGFFYPNVCSNGYHVMNFMLLYLIGRYIRVGKGTKVVTLLSRHSLPILALSWVIMFGTFLVVYVWLGKDMAATKLWGYNNPFVILEAVTLFVMFTKIDIQSTTINRIASLTFPVFLLHTGVAIQPFRNAFSHSVYVGYGYIGVLVLTLTLFATCGIIAYLVEILKRRPYKMLRQSTGDSLYIK